MNKLKESLGAIEEAARTLSTGGSIIYPTDTIYGLGVDATNAEAVKRLFKIKKRPKKKAIPIIVSDIKMARKVAYIDDKKARILKKLWSPASPRLRRASNASADRSGDGLGPVTVILQKKDILPDELTGGYDTVGVRIPDSKFARILVESLNLPITATSANISGEEPNIDLERIIERFNKESGKPDLVLDAGILPPSGPSTILDLSHGKPKIFRPGPVSKEQLLDILSI